MVAVGSSGRKVDHEKRTDEVVYFVHDRVAYNIHYYGRTEFFDALDSEPVWQIKRVVTSGTVQRTLFANFGKYNLRWDLRGTYFPAAPAAVPDPVVTPHGLTSEGKITHVTLSSLVWTELPVAALANRNALSIQNRSGVEIALEFDNTVPGYAGIIMPTGFERSYDITAAIPVYAKASAGAPIITVEELA